MVVYLVRPKKCPEPVTEQEIQKIIASFKNKFSSCYDDIPMPIIKFATEYLKTPLTHIINSSLISGIFPKELKVSKVKPHLKKGSKSFEAITDQFQFCRLFLKYMNV